ncbi:hypothetical protein Tco_0432871 [Tanacetum coccineum]
MDGGTTSNLATLRDFKEGLESLLRELREVIKDNQGNDRNLQIPCYAFQSSCYNSYIENNVMFCDTLNELKIKESKDAHKLFEKMPMNKLLTDCGHNDRELSKDNLSCDDNQCLGDENDTDVVSENKKIRALVNMGYGIDGSKVNSSANGIEEVSDYVMVLDDDCKETELGVSGMDGDNELVDNVTVETVEGSFEECESLSFDKRLDAALDIQTVAAITKTLSCSSRTGIGVNGHNMIVDEGCIQKDIHLFGICHDLKHVEGQEDEYRSFKVTDAHSSDKISTCVDERYMQEEGLGKGIIGEEEMNINEKHKEELDMIRPGIEVKRGSSNVDDTSAGVDTNSNYIRLISVTQENNASTMGVSKIGVVDVYDSMFNFSERDGSTNFNKLVEMYNGKYDDNKEEDDYFVVCDLVQSKGVDVLGKDYGMGFIKGLEDVNRTGNVSVQAFYIDNKPQIVQMCDFKLEQERSESLFPTFGSNGLADNGGICKPELETLGQILRWLILNPNRMMTNSGGTNSYDQTFTYGMEIEITMSGLNGNSLIVDLEAAKMNKVIFGLLKFDIWKWPKSGRKRAKYKVKNRGWRFDILKWPKRKKTCHAKCNFKHGKWKFDPGIVSLEQGTTRLSYVRGVWLKGSTKSRRFCFNAMVKWVSKVLSNNGTRVPGQVSNLVPDPLLHRGNIEVPTIVFVHELVPELLDVNEDTGIERAYSSPC